MKSPSNLPELDKMRVGTTYRFPIRIRSWSVQLRPVTIAEHMSINQEVINELVVIPENMRHTINESYLLAKYFLKAASKPDDGGTEGPLTDMLLGKMTVDEILYAYKQWLEGCKVCDPELEEIPLEDLEEMVEGLKKNQTPLTDLSLWELQNIVRHFLTLND